MRSTHVGIGSYRLIAETWDDRRAELFVRLPPETETKLELAFPEPESED